MNRTTSAILKTGLIAGSLDILLAFADAWLSWGVAPMRVLQFIASGLLGNSALEPSYGTALLGLAIHYCIALSWTLLFFVIYRRYKNIVRSPFLQAVLYGLLVWSVMNLLILPLTYVPPSDFQWHIVIKGMAILIIAIGMPLMHFARKHCTTAA